MDMVCDEWGLGIGGIGRVSGMSASIDAISWHEWGLDVIRVLPCDVPRDQRRRREGGGRTMDVAVRHRILPLHDDDKSNRGQIRPPSSNVPSHLSDVEPPTITGIRATCPSSHRINRPCYL